MPAGRRDREDRERPRSRVRDSSRHKRDSSTTRRDREKDRDDPRREKDDGRRDRDAEDEDPRRWRDDGKREERLASRRTDRARDRNGEQHWEQVQDRRWPASDDRDSRYKRPGPRDRKGNGAEDIRDKDERKDNRREEKEPAWMDTYIPSDSTPGILGGAAAGGELDGIQAWKKGMKEKETKEKEAPILQAPPETTVPPVARVETSAERPAMDEIQLFKMLMKQEEKKRLEDNGVANANAEGPSKPVGIEGKVSVNHIARPNSILLSFTAATSSIEVLAQTSRPLVHTSISTDAAIVASTSQEPLAHDKVVNLADLPSERTVSRLTSITTPQDSHLQAGGSFQPPSGSRLLALARTSQKNATLTGQVDAGTPLNLTSRRLHADVWCFIYFFYRSSSPT